MFKDFNYFNKINNKIQQLLSNLQKKMQIMKLLKINKNLILWLICIAIIYGDIFAHQIENKIFNFEINNYKSNLLSTNKQQIKNTKYNIFLLCCCSHAN